jgi:hypothetical protein
MTPPEFVPPTDTVILERVGLVAAFAEYQIGDG